MIHSLVKIITVDGFFDLENAKNLSQIVFDLKYEEKEYGEEIVNFNMVPENANKMFSDILNTDIIVDEDRSGIFRRPQNFIHFESFENLNEWVFVCALQHSTFNVFEHQSGAVNALQNYKFNYRNLFEWDLKINYLLSPGQGVLFRPWLFHSFDKGLIQLFRLKENGTQ